MDLLGLTGYIIRTMHQTPEWSYIRATFSSSWPGFRQFLKSPLSFWPETSMLCTWLVAKWYLYCVLRALKTFRGGKPIFFKEKLSKESKNGFKTISCRRYRMVVFSNYFFWHKKSGVYRRSIFKIRPNILIGLQKLRLRPKDRSQSRLFIYLFEFFETI